MDIDLAKTLDGIGAIISDFSEEYDKALQAILYLQNINSDLNREINSLKLKIEELQDDILALENAQPW